jgi:hypothetical protein
LIAATLAALSSIAVAEGAKPQPAIELPLEERGPCSVIECAPIAPRKRALILREIELFKRVLRNADLRPKQRELIRLHQLVTELLLHDQLALAALRARADAVCAIEQR